MTTLATTPAQRLAPIVWLVLFSSFWIKCAAYFSLPFLTIFLSKNTDLSLASIGLLVGLSPLAGTLGGFLGGHLSDRFGRRTIVLVSLAGSVAAYCGYFLGAEYAVGSPAAPLVFGALSVFSGLFSSFFWPVTQALISDVSTDEQRRHVFRYRYVITNVGGALGPMLAVACGFASAGRAFLVSAVFYAVLLALFAMLAAQYRPITSHETSVPRKSFVESLLLLGRDRQLLLFVIAAILFGIGYAQIESNLSRFVYQTFDDGVALFSRLLVLNALSVLLLQPFSHLVESRMPVRTEMLLGTALFCAGCLLMAALPTWRPALYGGVFVVTLGEVLIVPTLSALVDEIAPAKLRGLYFGAAGLRQLGPALGPACGGWVLAHTGPHGLFLGMAAVAVLSALAIGVAGKSNTP